MAAALLLLLLLLPFAAAADDGEGGGLTPSADAAALLVLKSSFANSSALSSWSPSSSSTPCGGDSPWVGVVCFNGILTGLRLESLGLSGRIDVDALSHFKSLRSLSLSSNSFSGDIPLFNSLTALKAVFLSNNQFSGQIPDDFFAGMVHLKKLHLSNNQFSGRIPSSLAKAANLVELHLDHNQFSGEIPVLSFSANSTVDVSNNALEGPIPASFGKFNPSSFQGNAGLCGPPLNDRTCAAAAASTAVAPPPPPAGYGKVAAECAGAVFIVFAMVALALAAKRRREEEFDTLGVDNGEVEAGEGKGMDGDSGNTEHDASQSAKHRGGSTHSKHRRSGSSLRGGGGGGGGGGAGDLLMVNEEKGAFGLADLMKAAAEVLGNGGLGSAYKAVMGNGVAVAVKRVREMNRVGKETFEVEMRRLGRLRHPNVLPPLAFHYRKDEKLLIYEYVPKGSLLYILHGDRGADHAALDWPTRLKIIVGVGRGMAYLHAELNSLDVPHGNLKSGNVLLAADFSPLIVDYGFVPLVNPSQASQTMFAYKSPETLSQRHVSPKSDVYCFGILILEVLTGKFPSQYLNNTKGGTDVVQWAASAIQENRVAELLDPVIIVADKPSVPDMERLLRIGAACIEPDPERRPDMKEAAEKVEELAREVEARGGEKGAVGSAPSLKESYTSQLSARRSGSISDRSKNGDNFAFDIS